MQQWTEIIRRTVSCLHCKSAEVWPKHSLRCHVNTAYPRGWCHTAVRYLTQCNSLPQVANASTVSTKFPGILRISLVCSTGRHLSLSRYKSNHRRRSQLHGLRYILVLPPSLCPGTPVGLFPSRFPTKIQYAFFFSSPYVTHAPSISSSSINQPSNSLWGTEIINFRTM